MRRFWLAFSASLLALPAAAVRPGPGALRDAKRFHLNRFWPPSARVASAASHRAFAAFNAAHGGGWRIRFQPRTGAPMSLTGGRSAPRGGRPEDIALAFLEAQRGLLGVDPGSLHLERRVDAPHYHHLLYRQTYKGLPVEFAAVKVHLDEHGSVLGVDSTYEANLTLPTTPAVGADAAAAAALKDAGGGRARGAPRLVILPLDSAGRVYLAWKVLIDAPEASWRYYVDAQDGQVVFRYNNLRFITCLTSGVVSGMVYDIDPSSTPGPARRYFNDQWVYLGDGTTRALTGGDSTYGQGFFCGGVTGKVAMSLQGPNVSVAEFRGPSAHYDNGGGTWSTVATPVSSPHPYPNDSVVVSTIDLAASAPGAVEFLPVFSAFNVGGFSGNNPSSGEGGDITDDDQVTIYDGSDAPVASYIGDRGAFNGTAVFGKRMHIALVSNASGQGPGYDVAVSSYLAFASPFTLGVPDSSHTWVAADTSQDMRGELDLFYHLNLMHDYFLSGVDKSSAAPVSRPVVAMAHAGPNMINAFYDPDFDDLFFGDVSGAAPSDIFMDDATVSHHEYTHYIVEKIWHIQNFGQAGAISEANADYFSASSLDDPAIGTYVLAGLGGSGPLRELDDTVSNHVFRCDADSCNWTGEIHDDSIFVSQALWDIRRNRVAALGHDQGRACADGLEFQALLFFPESFSELYDALKTADRNGAVAACGGAGTAGADIDAAFAAHGLLPSQGDAYENNDGFETAVDISTLGAVSATLYPAADTDFWSFGAGPGLVEAKLSLPLNGSFYEAYQLNLYNASRQLVANVQPRYDGFGTQDGLCANNDCLTTQSQVTLDYDNPSAGLLYLQVVGGDTAGGSVSAASSPSPYGLHVSFNSVGALSGSVVGAKFDNDAISFSVNVSTFVSRQDLSFAYAQLRNQSKEILPGTVTHVPASPGDWLLLLSSSSALGKITGQVQLNPGFAARFPAAGTVYLEVFAYDVLGSTVSLGLSNGINLTASQTELTAYNNVFNPLTGGKATVKYAVSDAGRLTIKLYTITGTFVKTLFDDSVPAGKGSVDWDGRNLAGSVVASGIYIVRADGPGLHETRKVAVVK